MEGTLDAVAVNVHHGAAAVMAHLGRRAVQVGGVVRPIDPHRPLGRPDDAETAVTPAGGSALASGTAPHDVWVSHEVTEALGTAGAIGHLRYWLNGRGVLVVNGDTWTDAPLAPLLEDWDGETARVLVVGGPFGPGAQVAGSLVPWRDVVSLPDAPAGLYEECWSRHAAAGTLDEIVVEARFADCGTPADYLAANLRAADGQSVVGEGAVVDGSLERSVVWPGGHVAAGEHLVDAVRTTAGRTVLVRR
jgi:N-acetyl-alpha-D-muramate 1-phosphate uridylyltransferase